MTTSNSAAADPILTSPELLEERAAANLHYIRETIDAARAFTLVPGRGCVVMGCIALLTATVEMQPAFSAYWLPLWLCAALTAATIATYSMVKKARQEGVFLSGPAMTRFIMTLAPAFTVGAVLTVALVHQVPRDIIAAIWLLSYGAGLAACGVLSIPAVVIAGAAFIGLGIVALSVPADWSAALLALGFGGIHIALGLIVMRRYDG